MVFFAVSTGRLKGTNCLYNYICRYKKPFCNLQPYSHGSDHSKGVCILIKPNSTVHADVVELNTNRIFIILRLKTQGEVSFNVVNVYAPTDNREQIEFLDSFIC